MDGHARLSGGLAQPSQKRLIVGIITHDWLVVMTLCDDMVQLIGYDESRQAGLFRKAFGCDIEIL